MKQIRLVFGLLGSGFTLFGQYDAVKFAAELRSRFGAPLPRQTFRSATGIEAQVDYAANGHVCRISLPPTGAESRNVFSTGAVDRFLDELVPPALRGKELRRMAQVMSLASVMTTEYENVLISESLYGNERTGITVAFVADPCPQQDSPPAR